MVSITWYLMPKGRVAQGREGQVDLRAVIAELASARVRVERALAAVVGMATAVEVTELGTAAADMALADMGMAAAHLAAAMAAMGTAATEMAELRQEMETARQGPGTAEPGE